MMKRQNVRTLSLIVCTFTYLLIGAAVFDALESENEIEMKRSLLSYEEKVIVKYNISSKDFERIRENALRSRQYRVENQWKFVGALYFSLVVCSVIGYGHSTPKTVPGKLFCMIYALVGIPLFLIMFQSVGERLNTFVTFLLKHIKRCFRWKNTEVSQTDLIVITLILSTIILTTGALLFSKFEGWKLLDALYYCFITLTTIGFGDFVAMQREHNNPEYIVMSLLFIIIGLTVISAAMNLLVLRFLTMNTEDERRDEIEAAVAAQNAVRLEGDVITGNGGVVSNAQERPDFQEVLSVCSCSCYKWRSPKDKIYNSNPNSNHISPFIHSTVNMSKDDELSDEGESFLEWQRTKRASL
ncbi:two pore potassium channel protein sup-9-like [Crassostrea virginica]|uniref:Two pore potassium channel protein sup-9-like n=1 Tax=Crassostrea virginica TaxID=6565 RepID=A0A8B8C246_CRAVI|nr:two pore potassium channel protein sup-9-like [Crassostrea virginica]XP_022310386.1 two pore potassium channel protein sup-9-like [Crassostrea virginica]